LNRQCAALFGPWLVVVGVLIGFDAAGAGVDLTFGGLAAATLLALAFGVWFVRSDPHPARPRIERDGAAAGERTV
jgi:hypothetical protein